MSDEKQAQTDEQGNEQPRVPFGFQFVSSFHQPKSWKNHPSQEFLFNGEIRNELQWHGKNGQTDRKVHKSRWNSPEIRIRSRTKKTESPK